jgi:hypothetical protein
MKSIRNRIFATIALCVVAMGSLIYAIGCAKTTRLLLILDPPYKGRWEVKEDPKTKYVAGSLIRIRPSGTIAYVPTGFVSSTPAAGGGTGTVEEWTLEGIEDPSGKRVANQSAIDRVSISISSNASKGKGTQFFLEVK